MNLEIDKKLNPYLANLSVMFMKLHDLHWKVTGKLFLQVHQHTESLYDDMAEKLDEVAEKIIMSDLMPVSKLEDYLKLATVKELGEFSYDADSVLKEVLKDYELLRAQALEIRNHFAEKDAFTVVDMLEDHISGYDKEIWFLKSMVK